MPDLISPVSTLLAHPRHWSWGQRIYLLLVIMALGVFGYAGVNHFRIRRYDALQREISAAGGTATRNLIILADSEEAYFAALQGDFAGVSINSVNGSGPRCTIDEKILGRMRQFPEITSLRLNRMPLGSADYQLIYSQQNLTRLNLAFNDLTDADLEGIEKLEAVEILDLQYTQLTDKSIPRLAKLPELTNLNLTGTDITADGVKRLHDAFAKARGTPSGEALDIVHRQSPSPALRRAVIRIQPTSSYGPDPRGTGMRLLLRREAWKGHEQEIPALAELTDVETVSIQRLDVSPPLLEALAALPKLRQISISDSPLQGCDLSILARNRSLTSLRLGASILDEKVIASLGTLDPLHSLSFFNCRLTSGGEQALARLPNLQSLSLREVTFEEDSLGRLLAGLEEAESLRHLELALPQLEEHHIPRLVRLRQLLSLSVSLSKISDAAIPGLAALSHLEQLDVSGTLVTRTGLPQLEALLPDCRIVHQDSTTARSELPLAVLVSLRSERERMDALIREYLGEVVLLPPP